MRHTEGSDSSKSNRSLIIEAMHDSVHSSLATPEAKAPHFSVSISSARCASSNFGGRPKRSGTRQGLRSALLCELGPVSHRLPSHAHASCHFRRPEAYGQQLHSEPAALLQFLQLLSILMRTLNSNIRSPTAA